MRNFDTQIENLFYNVPTRLSALRSPSEEYSKILDVMTKYAVHNPKIAFVCKKVELTVSLIVGLLKNSRKDLLLQS